MRSFQLKAKNQCADLVIFPEFTLSGYTLGEEILHATLDYEDVEKARDSLPLLKDMDIDFTIRELKGISARHLLEND